LTFAATARGAKRQQGEAWVLGWKSVAGVNAPVIAPFSVVCAMPTNPIFVFPALFCVLRTVSSPIFLTKARATPKGIGCLLSDHVLGACIRLLLLIGFATALPGLIASLPLLVVSCSASSGRPRF
jgi:hypothetical protein